MTDLVAALRWVHENIANFGGDPDRVMIYGQSGGGSKVTTLMGMPSAAGLFIVRLRNRVAVETSRAGAATRARATDHEGSRPAPNDIGSLQKMEWSKLFAAGDAAAAKINPPGPAMAGPAHRAHRVWVGHRASMERSSTCDRSSMPRPRFRRMCRC
jgi:para-nitrobenzyl esterase